MNQFQFFARNFFPNCHYFVFLSKQLFIIDLLRLYFHLKKRIDFDGSLSRRTESSLSPLAGRSQPSDGSLVCADVLLVLPLELVHEVRHHSVVEVLAAQVSVAGCRLDLNKYFKGIFQMA